MIFTRVSLSLLMLVSLGLGVAAQDSTPAPSATPATLDKSITDADLQKAGAELLRAVISDSDGFRLPDNRFAVKAIAANILWEIGRAHV